MLQKLNKLGHRVLPHSPYSADLSPTDHHFFKHLYSFLQRECFHNQQEAEDAFQELMEFQSMDFYATRVSKLISHWQKCVDCNVVMVNILIKDVFKSSYNELKFTV